jgi:Ca2+-binding RTX toxin-like protein
MGAFVSAGVMGVGMLPAGATSPITVAGVSAISAAGVLAVVGDAEPNTIVISRSPDGSILVNNGTVPVRGLPPTVTNTRTILVVGSAGDDVVSLDEANGPLPRASLVGGAGDDTLTGASGTDTLVGQAGNDVLLGRAGNDMLFGGDGDDVLTGGTGDDSAFGESGDDRLVWNPGDATDVNEGGAGVDATEVNGGNAAEQFLETANGTRVRFDRVTPAPFSIDIGTVENLVLNANGGDDSFAASGDLATLIATAVDGGAGNDTISGTNGADRLAGGQGNDFIDGQQGGDFAALGTEDDTFLWDPGDGSDTVEGEDGADTMVFNGNDLAEDFDISANGVRGRLVRNIGSVVMDTDDVETFVVNPFGAADNVTVGDLSATDITSVVTNLAAAAGGDDNAADAVTVKSTDGNDVAIVTSEGSDLQVSGLATTVSVTAASATNDGLTVATLGGDDVIEASGVAAGSAALVLDGGAGDDVLIGGDGDDTLLGGDGDDVLIGGAGNDVLDGGTGDNVLIDGESLVSGVEAGDEWLANHVHEDGDDTVLDYAGKSFVLL